MTSDNPAQHPHTPPTSWDIFCRVIDNHGDLGVCWRLSADLARRGHSVRLWVDDLSALSWMAPQAFSNPNMHVLPWEDHVQVQQPNAVVVEAFGCELPAHFQALMAQFPQTVWLNLEYLSAESYVVRQHGLPSPVLNGPAKGATKWFFYPGFTAGTGGLLREPDVNDRQARFDPHTWRTQWTSPTPLRTPLRTHERWVSLFCYEPEALAAWLMQLAQDATPTRLLVTPGRAQHAVRAVLPLLGAEHSALHIEWLPYLSQTDYDHLLWACDLNFVRGEDSLVRAIWAGKPWVWQIYPQHDQAHHAKLQALCDQLRMPADVQAVQRQWNGMAHDNLPAFAPSMAPFSAEMLTAWGHWSQATSTALQEQHDLTSQLIEFVRSRMNQDMG